jgi:BMFP domain-containing protein YqiC
MLSQLILETQEELAYLEQKLPRLRARLNSFQQLYRDLQRKTREDINDTDEVGDRIDDTSDEEE